jgi:hypothetical protein
MSNDRRMTNTHRALTLLVFVLALNGCIHRVTIVPLDPTETPLEQARVSADGVPTGAGTTQLRIKAPTAVQVDASPEYKSESFTVDTESDKVIRVVLAVDELYAATVADENKVINRWITFEIAAGAQENDTWWTAVVNAISGLDFEMEMMEARSGFVRTAWRETRHGTDTSRRRFVGNTVQQDPLHWRLKYEMMVKEGDQWTPYDRGFRDDLDALMEIRARTSN